MPLDSLLQQLFRNTARSCLPGKNRPFSHKCSSKSNIVARNLRGKMPLMRASPAMRTLARLSRPNVSIALLKMEEKKVRFVLVVKDNG